MHKPKPNPNPTKTERRKGSRFRVVVPIEVTWRGPEGVCIKQEAQAKEVNAHGGLLQMKTYPEFGSRVEITNFLSAESAQARVLGLRHTKDGAVLGVAVELVTPSETFWGVNFQLKKTNAELYKLEQALRSGGVDLRILREFRDAVEHVHTTAAAVQEWQELQLQGRDTDKVLVLLMAERIRRVAYLSNELAANLDTSEVTFETKGIAELYQAIERLYQRLNLLFEYHESKQQIEHYESRQRLTPKG